MRVTPIGKIRPNWTGGEKTQDEFRESLSNEQNRLFEDKKLSSRLPTGFVCEIRILVRLIIIGKPNQ